MSIVLEVLEEAQTTESVSNDPLDNNQMTRDDWIDVSIAMLIAFLVGVVIVLHYPSNALQPVLLDDKAVPERIEQAANSVEIIPQIDVQQPLLSLANKIPVSQPGQDVSFQLQFNKAELELVQQSSVKKEIPVQVQPDSAPIELTAVNKAVEKNDTEYRINHVLNGVFLSDQEKVAMINNRFFNIGDMVDGMKIVAIHADSVKLENDSGTIELRVVI